MEQLYATIEGNGFPSKANANQNGNPYTAKVEYKDTKASSWTIAKTQTDTFASFTLALDVTKSYEVRLTLSDHFLTVTSKVKISTAKTLMALYKDEGVGIGKMYETGSGVLDVGGTATFRGPIMMTVGGIEMAAPRSIKANEDLNEDLNSYIKAGFFRLVDQADLNTIKNLPEQTKGSLLVERTDGCKQTFTTFTVGKSRTYIRVENGGEWSVWTRIANQDQSAYLWKGSLYMRSKDIITPSKKLYDCANGWLLVWQYYNDSSEYNASVTYTVIPKYNGINSNGWGVYHLYVSFCSS